MPTTTKAPTTGKTTTATAARPLCIGKTISLRTNLIADGEQRARDLKRSNFSHYVATLIEDDLERAAERKRKTTPAA